MMITRRTLLLSAAASSATCPHDAPKTCPACQLGDETIDCFKLCHFPSEQQRDHCYYVRGSGPPVLLLHELPGLTKQDIRLANKIVCQGYTVILPLLFGVPGQDRFLHSLFTVCGKDQFDCGRTGQTPKAFTWIRNLCATIRSQWPDGKGIGIIGMCLTGEFPIPLLAVPDVKAAILCQPTDPFNLLTLLRLGPGSKLSLSKEDIEAGQKSTIPILGIKYSSDLYCPDKRFETISGLFPNRFYWLELGGSGIHHSSLGEDLSDIAFEEVCIYFSQQLKGVNVSPEKKFPHYSSCTSKVPAKVTCHPHANGCQI
jgi:dienelactone hydrolase